MAPPKLLFHALLRPCILQILRASGYHATRPAVLDFLTDLTASYLAILCEKTAQHAATASPDGHPTVVDVRNALQDCGAIRPEKTLEEQGFTGQEDVRGMDEFLAWMKGPQYREIRRIALDGDDEITDYLNALKKRHSKTNEDSRYHGTILGKSTEHGDVPIEGGDFLSIQMWMSNKHAPAGEEQAESRPASSGLSSLGDWSILEDMDMS